MRYAGHVARTGEMRNAYKLLVREQDGKRPPGRLNAGGWILLSWTLERWDRIVWPGLI
jgi:hypothetical protein